MKAQIYFANLKRAITGTTIGSSQAMDVNVANVIPITVVAGALTMKEYRFQKMSVTTLPKSSGTAVQIGDTNHAAADIANTITQLKASNNSGGSFNIYRGANSAALTLIASVGQGQTGEAVFAVTLVSGDKIWVKAIEDSDIISGQILVTLF